MEYRYTDLLIPSMYDPAIAAFIENLLNGEIDDLTTALAEDYLDDIIPGDAAIDELQKISKEAKKLFIEQGIFMPFFSFRGEFGQPLTVEMSIPATEQELRSLITFGKCLAFCTAAQIALFSSVFYHDNKQIVKEITPENEIGICTTGTYICGSQLQNLLNIDRHQPEIAFTEVSVDLARSITNAPIGKFHDIASVEEMSQIIEHIPLVIQEFEEMSKEDMLVNFGVTLKVTSKFSGPA